MTDNPYRWSGEFITWNSDGTSEADPHVYFRCDGTPHTRSSKISFKNAGYYSEQTRRELK